MATPQPDPVETYIAKRFQSNGGLRTFYTDLWKWFRDSGLTDPNFEKEIASGRDYTFEQRTWEMTLANHLANEGHALSSSDNGPDLRLVDRGRTVWIEAIAPTPEGLPDRWLDPPQCDDVISVPMEKMLLRWTAALKEKMEKLEGRTLVRDGVEKRRPGYREQGIVGNDDIYVIAIDPICLTNGRLIDDGTSGTPLAFEAALPAGPWAFRVDHNDRVGRAAVRTARYTIKNRNEADVPTDSFLSPSYAHVSAVVAASAIHRPETQRLRMIVVHNPLAKNPLPPGLFGAHAVEWTPERVGDGEFEFRGVDMSSPPRRATCSIGRNRRCAPVQPGMTITLRSVVDAYIADFRDAARAEMEYFFRDTPDFVSAVRAAALSRFPGNKKHQHQWRIPNRTLERAAEQLVAIATELSVAHSFYDLHRLTLDTIAGIDGIGDLTVYDIAQRIGAFRKIAPDRVYLHAGTLEGAKILASAGLVVLEGPTLPLASLPQEFHRLSAAEAEDCLCIFKSQLEARVQRRRRVFG